MLVFAGDHKPGEARESAAPRKGDLTDKKKKVLKSRLEALRANFQSRSNRTVELIDPVSNRSYDQTYEQGVAWLDSLAGDQFEPGEKIAEFSPEVWKSATRKGNDFS
jgi:hypothetical protein